MPLTDSFRGIWPVIETNGSTALNHAHQTSTVNQTSEKRSPLMLEKSMDPFENAVK